MTRTVGWILGTAGDKSRLIDIRETTSDTHAVFACNLALRLRGGMSVESLYCGLCEYTVCVSYMHIAYTCIVYVYVGCPRVSVTTS